MGNPGAGAAIGIGVCALGLALSDTSHAAGFVLVEMSAKGLGSAFSGGGAAASDGSTIFFNPAGNPTSNAAEVGTAHVPSGKLDVDVDIVSVQARIAF